MRDQLEHLSRQLVHVIQEELQHVGDIQLDDNLCSALPRPKDLCERPPHLLDLCSHPQGDLTHVVGSPHAYVDVLSCALPFCCKPRTTDQVFWASESTQPFSSHIFHDHQHFEGGVVNDNVETRTSVDRILSSISPNHMLLRKVAGDGNCLFRALSIGLHRVSGRRLNHEELRSLIVNRIIASPTLHNRFYDSVDFNNYIANMSKEGFYGDELCIQSFVECLDVGVCVYHPRGRPVSFGASASTIHLAHNGVDHFDVYVPKVNPDVAHASLPSDGAQTASSSVQHQPLGALPTGADSPVPDAAKKQDTITLLSINTNSWKLHKDNLLPTADILMLQETRLTAKGQRDECKSLNGEGFVAHWGAACNHVSRDKAKGHVAFSCSGTGKQGGVGILCKKGLGLTPTCRHFKAQILHQTARWCRAAIPLAKSGAKAHQWLHLVSFYNISGHDNGFLKSRKERLLCDLFSDCAGLGDQPTLICADCNSSVSTPGAITTALSSGRWFDVAVHFTGNNPGKTFCPKKQWDDTCATRPDMIFANKAALALITSFRVVEDLSPKGHRGLELKLRFDFELTHYKCLKQPKAFPPQQLQSMSFHNRSILGQACVDKHESHIAEARKQGPDEAWRAFSKMAEDYLRQGCRHSDVQVEGGRHSKTRYQQRTVCLGTADKGQPEGTSTFALNRLHKTLRIAKELFFKVVPFWTLP